jgi:hypothetical protein
MREIIKMKRILAVFNNITTLMIVMVLITAILWVMLKQRQVIPLTAQTTLTPSPMAIEHKPTVQNTPTFIAESAIATSTAPFIFVTPYSLGTPVPTSQPTQTPTSTPVPAVQVISKNILSLDILLSQLEIDTVNLYRLVDWTPENDLILEIGYPPEVWAVSYDKDEVRQLPYWEQPILQPSEIISSAINEIKQINPSSNDIGVTEISPDGQWVAGGVIDDDVLLVKKIGTSSSPQSLLSEPNRGQFARFLSWSPDSNYLAYATYTGEYEIRINTFDDSNTTITKLGKIWRPFSITWSSDQRLIAFMAQIGAQQTTDVYIMKADGSGLINITQDDVSVGGNLVWSPDSQKIAYIGNNQVWVVELSTK